MVGGRLQKLWNGANQEPITRAVPTTKQDLAQQEELQREIERVTQVPQQEVLQREIVVGDFFARLGQLEAQMERQTTQMEIQTEKMQNILDSLDPQCAEEEALQEIGKSVQEDTWFGKTLVYCAATGFAVWLYTLCNNKALPCKTPAAPAPKVASPTTPAPAKLGWIKKREPDEFVME